MAHSHTDSQGIPSTSLSVNLKQNACASAMNAVRLTDLRQSLNTMKPIICIYHRADFDGIFCREIARKFLPESDTTYIGWDYGDPVPEIAPESVVYMLDISVEGLMHHPNLFWIDHHKSAMEKYPESIQGYRIDGVAACRLAWQYFNGRQPTKEEYLDRTVKEPFAVRLAGEYDIWDKRDERADLFQHGLRSQELTNVMWADMLDPDATIGHARAVQMLLTQGKAIQFSKTNENASVISQLGFTIHFESLCFLACNHAVYNSHLFTEGLRPEHDACFGFKFDGTNWRISLYHAPGKEHHDLSLIASAHGGGGHRGACGFILSTEAFMPIISPISQ